MADPIFNFQSSNPFGLSNVGAYASPTFVDIDGDGDLDAFVGNSVGNILFFENTGSASSAAFASRITNPFGLSAVGSNASPTFVDIDGDGDLDAFVGNTAGEIWFFRNTPHSSAPNTPVFSLEATNPFGLSNVGNFAAPTFVDIDGDGDLDAFVGNRAGEICFFRNTPHSSAPNTPVFSLEATNPFGLSDVKWNASPTFVDIDGDGNLDAFVVNNFGEIRFFRNTPHSSAPNTPVFSLETTNLFGLSDVGSNASPTFVDIDGDGDLDAFVGNMHGNTLFFLNEPPPGVNIAQTGGSTAVTEGGATDTYTLVLNAAPTAEVTITLDNTNKQVTSDVATLTFTTANWNVAQTVTVTAVNDSVGEGKHSGVIKHTVTSTGSNYDNLAIGNVIVAITDNDLPVGNPTFNTPSTNPFGLSKVGTYASPTLVDIDGDGDLDAFVGNRAGDILFFENTGSASSPVFAAPSTNPFGLSNGGWSASPTFVDIDGDGDLDAFVGNWNGDILFFENTGNASSAAFAAPVTNDPFGLSTVGNSAAPTPTFVDIDGDGDLDAFVGNGSGDTLFFENTGNASSAAFTFISSNPFGLSKVEWNASPTFVDIDGDGDLDAFVGNMTGNTWFFENTGSASGPAFAYPVSSNPFGLSKVDNYAAPTFVDIDGDGDLDAFVGNGAGDILFFLNDNTPPVFASATVNGNTLVMSYTEATTLDAVNIPFPGAFVVLVGATANTVTAVVVNAVNKTVTLTLASAVANGNTVTVAYNDPTVNNDVNAIQDAGGTDAATLTATLVTNDTPAPTPGPSPAPSPSPVPAPVPTTEKLDGVVVTRTTATATATVTHPVTGKEQIITTEVATTTIPIIHDTRTDTNNATPQADIPLVRDRSGDTILQASLPVGVGLTSEAISGGDNLTLRELLMVASGPRTDASSFIDILGQGIDSYVTGVADETQVTVRTLTFQTDPGASDQIAAPNAPPIAINGEQNHPDHQKALIIDVRNLPHGSVLQLNNVEFAIIIGAIKLIGGSGRNIIIADNADQFIVLGADDDVLRGGGGDDTVGSLDGNDQTFGDEGNDVVYGGAGNDQLSGGSGNDQMNGGFGFDVALQLGALSDYQVMRLGSSVILTHNSSGEQDSFTDVEQIRFDSGPALTLAHSQAEAVAGHLVATWLHRNLTADEGTYVQHYLSTASADDVVKAFLTLPETANLTTRSSDGLLAGLNTNPSILNLDVHRDLIFSAANDQGYLPFGLALTVDGGAGFDVLHLSGTRKDMHLAQKANVLELTQLKDGCMLNLINAEILAFDSGETVVLAHNPTEGILGRLVHTFFNRDATINEWQQGLQALQAHVAPDTILNWFQDRANLQGLNNNDYIQTLHQNTFNRAASLEELGHYQQQLDQGTLDRNGLAVELAASSEAIATVGTVMQFEGWL
ncbi:MAG: FG-GAP-like repeat-containing protein [Methylobacter sp.]|nr:FG-GAP-like repeat-containing protein [Methylobacter sp.]